MPIVKLTVITALDGTVVGTKQLVEPGASLAPEFPYRPTPQAGGAGPELVIPVYSQLVAGPDQQAHVIDVDLPDQFFVSLDPTALHKIVQARLNELKSK